MTAKPPHIRPHTPTKQAAEKQLRQAIAGAGGLPCMVDPEWWYAGAAEQRHNAASLCQACTVLAECGAYANALPRETWGVWGGVDMSARTRRTKNDRPCERCGEGYDPTHSGQLYCSKSCAAKARRESQLAHDKRKRVAA